MASRLDLQSKLEELLGNRNVYYQPPASIKMTYPAIVYSKSNLDIKRADNQMYNLKTCYELTVIDKKPDNPIIEQLLILPYCSFNRHYVSDNLNHDVLMLYY